MKINKVKPGDYDPLQITLETVEAETLSDEEALNLHRKNLGLHITDELFEARDMDRTDSLNGFSLRDQFERGLRYLRDRQELEARMDEENFLPPDLAAEFEIAKKYKQKNCKPSQDPKPDESHATPELESEFNPMFDLGANVTVDKKKFLAQLSAMTEGEIKNRGLEPPTQSR